MTGFRDDLRFELVELVREGRADSLGAFQESTNRHQ